MAKKQVGLRVEGRLKDGLQDQAKRSGKPETTLLEEYIAAGLARDNGELVEQNSLPAIRVAVKEEVAKAMQELYQQLSTDLQKSARRSDDRLAALIVKAARYSGIGQRMLYSLMAKTVNPDFAAKMFETAKEQTGKDIARPDETKPSDPRN
jgi:CRP-like cAMP-binding protein